MITTFKEVRYNLAPLSFQKQVYCKGNSKLNLAVHVITRYCINLILYVEYLKWKMWITTFYHVNKLSTVMFRSPVGSGVVGGGGVGL
jgi:hypothetical protein